MPVVKLRTQGQVTIPGTLRKQLNLCEGDVLDVQVVDGCVIMQPKHLVSEEPPQSFADLENGYKAMAEDTAREQEALEWSEALLMDAQDA